MILLLSSCNDTSGTYLISEVTFKDNNLSEQEKQETINEFLNREVHLTVLTEKVELVLSDKPSTSKIILQPTAVKTLNLDYIIITRMVYTTR